MTLYHLLRTMIVAGAATAALAFATQVGAGVRFEAGAGAPRLQRERGPPPEPALTRRD